MQVQPMHGVPRHDVEPAVGHRKFPACEIPLDGLREGLDVTLQLAFQILKRRRHLMQFMRRTVRGVAAAIVLCGPAAAGSVVVLELPALLEKLPVQFPRTASVEDRGVDMGRKQFMNAHERLLFPTVAPAMKAAVPATTTPARTASHG